MGNLDNPDFRKGMESSRVERKEPTKHPELREGEIFLGNVTGREGISNTPYRSARIGDKAYDSNGQRIKGLVLLFANKEEVDET